LRLQGGQVIISTLSIKKSHNYKRCTCIIDIKGIVLPNYFK